MGHSLTLKLSVVRQLAQLLEVQEEQPGWWPQELVVLRQLLELRQRALRPEPLLELLE